VFNKAIILFVIIFSIHFGHASPNPISRDQAKTLMEACQILRQDKIASLRTIEINKCINDQGNDVNYCTRFYDDFGGAYRLPNGVMKLGLFWDIRICEHAVEVEKYFMLYPSKAIYQFK